MNSLTSDIFSLMPIKMYADKKHTVTPESIRP